MMPLDFISFKKQQIVVHFHTPEIAQRILKKIENELKILKTGERSKDTPTP
jgi:hypothetical protein